MEDQRYGQRRSSNEKFSFDRVLAYTISFKKNQQRSGIGIIMLLSTRRFEVYLCLATMTSQFLNFISSRVSSKVWSSDLLWLPDPTWPEHILSECGQWMYRKFFEVWARYLQAFRNGRREATGRGYLSPPPWPGMGLKHSRMLFVSAFYQADSLCHKSVRNLAVHLQSLEWMPPPELSRDKLLSAGLPTDL